MILYFDAENNKISLKSTQFTPVNLDKEIVLNTKEQPHYAAFNFIKQNTDILPLLELEKQLPEVKERLPEIMATLGKKPEPVELPNGTVFVSQSVINNSVKTDFTSANSPNNTNEINVEISTGEGVIFNE